MKVTINNISLFLILAMAGLLMSLPALSAEVVDSAKETKQSKITGIVNINTASAKQLSKGLMGVGKVKAEAIVAYRESNGEFKKIEDLLKVEGIGKKILENNKERLGL